MSAAELLKNDFEYRLILDNLIEGCQVLGIDWRYLYINKTGEIHTGRHKEDLIGKKYADIWPGIKKSMLFRNIRQCFEDRLPKKLETEFEFTDGTRGWFDVSIQPLHENVMVLSVDISDCKRTENALIESREQFRTIFEQATDGIFISDEEGNYTDVNSAGCELLGYTKEEIVRLTIADIVTPDQISRIGPAIEKLAREGTVRSNWKFRRRDNTVFLGEVTTKKLSDGRLQAFLRDITELKAAEEALRESETKFRKIYEDGPFGMALVNNEFRFISANTTYCHILGYTEQELQNLTFTDITFADDIKTDIPFIDKLIQGEIPYYKTEKRYVRKDGQVIWGALSVTANFNSDGKFQYNVAIVEDITGRKVTEEALNKMTERLELATRSANIGIWDWDIRLNKTVWDAQMYKLYGLSLVTIPGEYENWLSHVYPDDRDYSNNMVQLALSGVKDYNTEYRVVWPDESLHYMKASAKVFHDEQGTPVRMVGVNYDITERKMAEREIISLNSDLENKVKERTAQLLTANKELEAFTYSVSHDLRAPLRGINGFIEILLEDYAPKLDDEGKRICSVIQENSQKMGHLIGDLLVFSRLSVVEMQLSLIRFSTLINTIYYEITDAQLRERIELNIDNICEAPGDPNMMRQVWINLLSNAIKFSSLRPKAIISISCKNENGKCIYCIKDNGVGFDMTYVNKLFKVFERLHSARDFEGTGVGLAIVQRIIQRHGGEVWAEGEVNKGASFYFSLPAKANF